MSRLVDISPYENCRIVLHPEDTGFKASELPTADAEPVKHGHWEKPYLNYYGHPCHCCSRCGFKASHYDKNYCPECGAKMDEEDR